MAAVVHGIESLRGFGSLSTCRYFQYFCQGYCQVSAFLHNKNVIFEHFDLATEFNFMLVSKLQSQPLLVPVATGGDMHQIEPLI